MKNITLLTVCLLSLNAFSQSKIYRLSGSYVCAENIYRSDEITADEVFALDNADEILNIENSIKHTIPEFYFSTDGEYGVTNWVAFPSAPKLVGSEFKLKVWKTTDNGIRLSTWGFKYCYFTGWNKKTNQPNVDKAGQNQTAGAKHFRIGKNSIVGGTGWSKDFEKRGWLIVRIDKIDTSTNQQPAEPGQITLFTNLLQAIQQLDGEQLKSLYLYPEKIPTFYAQEPQLSKLKSNYSKTIPNPDKLSYLYAGNNKKGLLTIITESGKEYFQHIIKVDGKWKFEK